MTKASQPFISSSTAPKTHRQLCDCPECTTNHDCDNIGTQTDELTAHVRYAILDDGQFKQRGLRPATDPIPDKAKWVSTGIYYLTSDEVEALQRSNQTPRSIQEQCETDGRVKYAVIAESDGLDLGLNHTASTVVDCLKTFAEDWLMLNDYQLHFSGHRSIHLHTKKLIPSEEGRKRLKERAEEFNAKTDYPKLDPSIYHQKSQFRLAGVTHEKTNLNKFRLSSIDLDDITRQKLVRQAEDPHNEIQWPFPDITKTPYNKHTPHYYCPGVGGRESKTAEIDGGVGVGYLNGSQNGSGGDSQSELVVSSAFSPYAKAGDGNSRSVCLMEQTGSLIRVQETDYVEARIREAIGAGGEFRRYNYHGFVKLSKPDKRKWEFETGDIIVIIGGRSGSSRLICLTDNEELASGVELALESDRNDGSVIDDGRKAALKALRNNGYEVGERGYNGDNTQSEMESETRAARLKREIENGKREPDHDNLLSVCGRLLRLHGWWAAWEWVKDTYGDDFDAEETYEKLATFVNYYDDYDHVSVPESVDAAISADNRGLST